MIRRNFSTIWLQAMIKGSSVESLTNLEMTSESRIGIRTTDTSSTKEMEDMQKEIRCGIQKKKINTDKEADIKASNREGLRGKEIKKLGERR